MAMLASALAMASRASPRLAPSARLNEMVVASSPSSWLTEVATDCSSNFATADSGTRLVAVLLSTLPDDALRSAGLADTGTAVLAVLERLLDEEVKTPSLPVVATATCVVTVCPATTEVRVAGT
jgi:hypothetical protein